MRFLKTSAVLIVSLFTISAFLPSVSLAFTITQEDVVMLSKISRNSFQYFLDYTDKNTGLTRDSSQPGAPASIAATGFYLASLGVAKENGWLPYREAYKKAKTTLTTALRNAEHKNGFYYREYRLEMISQTDRRNINGLAYRSGSGRWKTTALFFN